MDRGARRGPARPAPSGRGSRPSTTATSTGSPRCGPGTAPRSSASGRSTSTIRSTAPSRSCSPSRTPGTPAQRASRLLLVDEFQDLTPAHLLLVRLLSAPAGDVFGVGDDDQTIYGYNGADPTWLIDFADLFPGAGDHPLKVNYRCPAGVVASADRLLRHNRRRVAKIIRAGHAIPPTWSSTARRPTPSEPRVDVVAEALAVGCARPPTSPCSPGSTRCSHRCRSRSPAQGIPCSRGRRHRVPSRAPRCGRCSPGCGWPPPAGRRSLPTDLHEALRRPSRPLHPRIGEWVAEQRDVDGLRRLAAGSPTTATRSASPRSPTTSPVCSALADGGADTEALVAHARRRHRARPAPWPRSTPNGTA